jgi:hypothetical protein
MRCFLDALLQSLSNFTPLLCFQVLEDPLWMSFVEIERTLKDVD